MTLIVTCHNLKMRFTIIFTNDIHNKKALFPGILTFSIHNIKFLNNNHLKESSNN